MTFEPVMTPDDRDTPGFVAGAGGRSDDERGGSGSAEGGLAMAICD